MSWYIQTVENGLDSYVQTMQGRGIDPNGFRCATIATLAGVSRSNMSLALQQYRMAQSQATVAGVKPKTKYVIACEEYGPMARWRILSKPGSDPMVVQNARRQHGKWIVRDAIHRFISDRVHEVLPGLKGAQHDQLIETVTKLAENQLDATMQFVDSML